MVTCVSGHNSSEPFLLISDQTTVFGTSFRVPVPEAEGEAAERWQSRLPATGALKKRS
jgi:hypothetical protein